VAKFTLSNLIKIKKILEENSIKTFKGFVGYGSNGFFEIKSQFELEKLHEAVSE